MMLATKKPLYFLNSYKIATSIKSIKFATCLYTKNL